MAKTMMKEMTKKLITEKKKRRGLFAALLTLLFFVNGCAPITSTVCKGDSGGDLVLEETIFQNVTFEIAIAAQQGLRPAKKFWFADRDSKVVRYGWEDIILHERDPEEVETCNYQNTSAPCKVCNICNHQCSNGDRIYLLPTTHSFGDLTELAPDGTTTVVRQANRPDELCFRTENGSNPSQPQFNADKDETSYGFTSRSSCGQTKSEWHLQTNVVKGVRTIREPLEVYQDPVDPAPRYRFRMPEVNGILRDNFSSSLKILKVRILLGIRNVNTGVEMEPMQDPESLRRVRPSRVLFLRDFREGNINRSPSEPVNRCYVDPTKDDGGFDFVDSCLRTPGGTHFAQNVTPTYQNGNFNELLDWVIEYKTSDGIPALPDFQTTSETEEFPVIEWTIDQN